MWTFWDIVFKCHFSAYVQRNECDNFYIYRATMLCSLLHRWQPLLQKCNTIRYPARKNMSIYVITFSVSCSRCQYARCNTRRRLFLKCYITKWPLTVDWSMKYRTQNDKTRESIKSFTSANNRVASSENVRISSVIIGINKQIEKLVCVL